MKKNEVYFIYMSTAIPAFFCPICMKYLFPSPHFQAVCVFSSEVSLMQVHIDGSWIFTLISQFTFLTYFFQLQLKSYWQACALTAFLLLVFWLFCSSLFLFFFRLLFSLWFDDFLQWNVCITFFFLFLVFVYLL